MCKFKIDVMWNNNDCLDVDAIQDYIEADNSEIAKEYVADWLIEHGVNVENEVSYIVANEIE